MNTFQNRDGFALPMAILVIGFLTAGVVASFTRVGAEIQTVDNVRGQTGAFAMAEAGLAEFMNGGQLMPGQDSAVRNYTFPGGTATVRVNRIFGTTQNSLVVISSEGAIPGGGPGRPEARRTVAQFATQQPMQMQVLASWTSLSGVHKNGNSGWFGGEDQAGTACGDGVTRAGIALPDGLASGEHIEDRASGDPAIDYMGSPQEMANQIDINWQAITDPTAPAIRASGNPAYPNAGNVVCMPSTYGYDATYAGGSCGGWPTNYNNWPTVVVNGSTTLDNSGRGVLIVTGNLRLIGNQNWDGVILVGGKIEDNGQGIINGSVITGLNVLKGESVEESEVDISLANGQKRYQFDSCMVQNALAGATSGFQPMANTWVDNWSNW
ncbi:MAG TPA: hypothetical protein VK929_15585 [Longimicrobiales bacterium]|nr:hypothetical protein [Longimicrobiales bacterium]